MTFKIFAPPKSRIIGAMRRIFSMSELYKHVKNARLSEEKGPRGGKMVVCDGCGKSFPWSSTQVDHVEDVTPVDKSAAEMSYDEIVERMWCMQCENQLDNLQVLCKECHDAKTEAENKIRRANKKAKKEANGSMS